MNIRIWFYGLGDVPQRWHLWRNFWEYVALGKAFEKLGHSVTHGRDKISNADIDLLLYGKDHVQDLTASRKFGWIDGHPDFAMEEDWSQYEHVWIRSHHWLHEFKKIMPRTSVLLGAPTNTIYTPRDKEPEYDIAFLGASSKERVETLQYLIDLEKYKIIVGGAVADNLTGKFDHAGPFIQNDKMGEFYNRAWTAPYVITNQIDTEWGFVSSAPYDIAATSDCLVLHEYNRGLRFVFAYMPMFRDFVELSTKIDYYLKRPSVIEDLARTNRAEANLLTFDMAAEEMEKMFEK